MKYIINLVIIFDPYQRTLTLNNNPQTAIELSKPSCRVFNELIKNQGASLTRDELLKTAWEDFGFPASNASLNNCISEIRKAFISLGVEDKIIITIQRIGFKLEANIHPVPKNNEKNQTEHDEIKLKSTVNSNEKTTTITLIRWTRGNRKLSVLIVFFIVVGAAVVGAISPPANNPTLIGTYEMCNIYSTNGEKKPPSFGFRAEEMLKKTSIDCSQEEQDVFYIESRTNNDRLKVSLLAACVKSDDGHYQFCNNVKIVE
jgi:DNA-binding winged helix-turn-helix (wHTH) protein